MLSLAKLLSIPLLVSAVSLRCSPTSGPFNCGTPAFSFTNCGSTSLLPTSVTLTPEVPVRNQNLAVSVTGSTYKDFISGTVDAKISLGSIPILDKKLDACTLASSPCPIKAGQSFSLDYTTLIPSYAPVGKYTIQLTVEDQTSSQVGCVSFETQIN